MGERLPYFFLAVLGLSFLFLMAVFRSLLVPLKAVVMNMLSIGASYGVIVALFQWGWFGSITGLSPGPIESWAPMMLFAIVFGLSMDYEVFLLSRVREEFNRTGDSHTSVADGLAATAKVITAAAAIMVVVFGSFLLENDRTFKLMGTGLSVAVLARRHHRPHAARAGDDGTARRPQLVAAGLARSAAAQHLRRRPPREASRPSATKTTSASCNSRTSQRFAAVAEYSEVPPKIVGASATDLPRSARDLRGTGMARHAVAHPQAHVRACDRR